MSASPVARQAAAQAQPQCIPRRVTINSPADLPNDYSTTPGGTLFSTTPGGTRIIYERNFLLQIRNSPLAKTPPKNLPVIPGVTSKDTVVVHRENGTIPEESEKTGGGHVSSRKNKKGTLIQIRLPKDKCPQIDSNKNASQGGFTLGADTFIPTKDNCIPLSAGFSYSFVGGKQHRKVGSYLIPLRSGSIVTNVVVYVFLTQEHHVDQKYIATRLLCKAEKNLGRVISSKWIFKIPVFLAPASPGLCPS